MSGISDVTTTSLAVAVARRTGKIIKSGLPVFEIRVAKLEFKQTKNRLF